MFQYSHTVLSYIEQAYSPFAFLITILSFTLDIFKCNTKIPHILILCSILFLQSALLPLFADYLLSETLMCHQSYFQNFGFYSIPGFWYVIYRLPLLMGCEIIRLACLYVEFAYISIIATIVSTLILFCFTYQAVLYLCTAPQLLRYHIAIRTRAIINTLLTRSN